MTRPGNRSIRRILLLFSGLLAFACLALAPSAGAAEPFELNSDIAYGPATTQAGSNLLDVYVPKSKSTGRRPVFVWIHGGGWFQGDKVNGILPKARVLTRNGFIFVSVNYRLSPDLDGPLALTADRLRFPACHEDAAKALGWVSNNIAEYGGSPNRMVIGGDSAGGQISSLLATRPTFLKERGVSLNQIKGVFSADAVGFSVNRMMTPAYRKISAGFQKMMFNAFGTPAEELKSPRWAAASPVRFADRTDPPTFFVVPTSSPDRWTEARKMAGLLGQRFPLVSWRVDTNHPGVVPLLGNTEDDMGVTARAMRFIKAAVEPFVRYRPVVRGSRIARIQGKAMTAAVRLQIGSRPAARQITCQIDNGRVTLCPRVWNLRAGLHKLRVSTWSDTGRVSMSSLVKLRVTK